MNEQLFAYQVRQALEESTERLPFRVTHRLAKARERALSRMPAVRESVATLEAAGAGTGTAASRLDDRPSLWFRLASVVLPLLVVAAGLYGIALWTELEDAVDTAEVDAALLADDVPIAAYVDKGFGVYIRNNRQ